ncbi:hypothetical protein BLAT2472_20245 [Burkholderia latens]
MVFHFYSPSAAMPIFLSPGSNPGLVGRSAKVLAVPWPEAAYVPRRAQVLRFRGGRGAGSIGHLPIPSGRHLVDCRAEAYAKSRPYRQESMCIKGFGDTCVPAVWAQC